MNFSTLPYLAGSGASGPPTGGRSLWFKADAQSASDGDRIASITDQSGNANHGVQATGTNKPTYKTNQVNGLAAYDFGVANASDQWVDVGSFFTGYTQGEIFIVLRTRFDPPDDLTRSGSWHFGTLDTMPVYNSAGDGSNTNLLEGFGSSATKTLGYPGVALNSWHLYNVSSKASEFTVRINGVQKYQTLTNIVGWAGAGEIGRSKDSSVSFYYFRGQIAEVFFYDHVLTGGDRTLVETYLLAKYALPVVQSATLSITANLVARWEADNVSGADGDAIGTWTDQSASTRDATQATGANKPLLKLLVFGSKSVLRFDGTNDQLNFTHLATTNITAFVVWNAKSGCKGYAGPLAWRNGAASGFQITSEDGSAGNPQSHLVITNGANGEIQNKTKPSEALNLSLVQRGRKIDVWRWDGTTAVMKLNGVGQTVSTGTGGYSTECAIGHSYDFIAGDIAAILVYSTNLSDGDVATVESYLNAKYPCYW